MTEDHLAVVACKRERLSGKLSEFHGITKEEAGKQIEDWQQEQEDEGVVQFHGASIIFDGGNTR